MMGRSLALLALLALAGCAEGARRSARLSFDEEAAKNRPVSKVITLLKDMLKQLEKEAEEDEAIYDKLACWCETNDKEKSQAVTDAQGKIADLQGKVEELTAASARLSTEIKILEKEVAEGQQSLDQATALRQKQLAEFTGEEKDLLESIGALRAAITVLSKHHTSLAQLNRNSLEGLTATVFEGLKKHEDMLKGVLTPNERKLLRAFLQAPSDFLQQPAFKQDYAPQSGEIFGILKQMKETFESNLAETQKEEAANQAAYTELKSAKEEEIAAAQSQLDKKTQELADTDSKNAHSKQDIEDTQASLDADQKFLMMLKEKCAVTDKEWEERQRTRQEEMKAVSEALSVLSNDDSHDTFTRTFNPALIQTADVKDSKAREKAASLLLAVGQKTENPRISALAYRMRLDAFEKVKKAIDDMIAQLIKEKSDEVKHKDFCTDEFHKNELQTEKKERKKQDLSAKLSDLDMSVKSLQEAVDGLKNEIAEMRVQMKRAGENREKENSEFQKTVADQRETQNLLKRAIHVLNSFYNKDAPPPVLAQKKQEPAAGPPPPPSFSNYEKNAGSGGVLALLNQILNDAKAMETEALRAEEDAQKTYEDFVKETNKSIESKSKEIVERSEEKATAETNMVQARDEKSATGTDLEQLSNYNAELHASCDFVLKNFELRQTARDEEVEALRQAKAILSGADFSDFLQAPQ